jgi:hypothetical protein
VPGWAPVKTMSKLLRAAGLALALVAALGFEQPLRAAKPILLAVSRCNDQTVDDASSHLRDYDRHAPGSTNAQLMQRFGAIADVLAMLNEEREILQSVCSSDAERAPLFTQIAATAAWALALESDIAAQLNASSCPPAAKALPTMMLADAWLSLADIVNDGGGTVPPAFAEVIPKVQTRAQAVGLPLPAWAETSAYWRDQVDEKAKASMAPCPSPSPSPTPS